VHFALNQLKVISAIERCRTGRSEGMFGATRMSLCHTLIAYNSCRNGIVPSVSSSCCPSTLPVVYTVAEAFRYPNFAAQVGATFMMWRLISANDVRFPCDPAEPILPIVDRPPRT
jgi:hypothetical protein